MEKELFKKTFMSALSDINILKELYSKFPVEEQIQIFYEISNENKEISTENLMPLLRQIYTE